MRPRNPSARRSIAAGSAIGGVLVDSAGLIAVYTVAGSIALASATFALIAGREEHR
jgi:predicted MFS family arabinose efflux permease